MTKAEAKKTQGRTLLKKLIDAGQTQAQISTALNVRQSSVSLWANGLDRPKPHYRRALERLFSIPQDAWFTPEERRIALGIK